MSARKLERSLDNFRRALERLAEALVIDEPNALQVDGTIRRFEFCIELCWKTIKRALEKEGIRSTFSRATIKEAYSICWLDDEGLWLSMLEDRNAASHIYDEAMALAIYRRIPAYCRAMQKVLRGFDER